MKPFDLEKAKVGAPVCTRNGYDVRIICYDRKDDTYPIIALITYPDGKEEYDSYTIDGKLDISEGTNTLDLIMKTIKHEGWINLYKASFDDIIESVINCFPSSYVYKSKEDALNNIHDKDNYISTVKVEWEE